MRCDSLHNPTTVLADSRQPSVLSPEQGLAQEMALLDRVACGEVRAGYLLWRCRRAVVVPRALARKSGFDYACRRLEMDGWPVVIRQTGGDVTVQSPGLLNVSLVFRCRRSRSAIRESYQTLCNPLIASLKRLGIDAYCASVEGAFCDGDYNLVVDGRKLAGTAQRWRRMKAGAGEEGEFAVLAHAVILGQDDTQTLLEVTNDFYRYCAMPPYVQQHKHVSLAELLPAAVQVRQNGFVDWLTEAFEQELAAYHATL